ncbi:MAG: leucine-rich repeat protein [archaeon]|nr:leucine-rich repeat protein [archaeon]
MISRTSRVLTTLLALVIVVSAYVVMEDTSSSDAASSEGTVTQNGIVYTLYSDGTANLTNAPKTSVTGDVTVPGTVVYNGSTYTVVSVGGGSGSSTRGFYNNTNVTSVTLPDTVTRIGGYSFSGCSSLKTVDIGDSVTSIDAYAFQKCVLLGGIVLPSTLTAMGNYVFNGCTALASVEIPYGVVSLPDYFMQGCTSLVTIDIPGSVTSIGKNAFNGCTSLVSAEVPSSVTSIGNGAFTGCDSLQNSVILNGTLLIGAHVPVYTVPSDVRSIAASAFSKNTVLKSVTIPSTVTSVGDSAFEGCTSLSDVVFKDISKVTLGTGVFKGCISFTKEIIVGGALYFVPAVKEYNVPSTVTNIIDYAGAGNTVLEKVTIPSSVEMYGAGIFQGCTSLADVTLPANITFINDNMFDGCTSLSSIDLPVHITNINSNAFRNTGLTGFMFHEGLTDIGSYAFYGTPLVEVTLPRSLSTLGQYAFAYCASLMSVDMPVAPAVLFDAGVFYNDVSLVSFVFPDGTESVPSTTFRGCTSLSEIVLPSSVKTIGQYAFNSTALRDVDVPEGVVSIGVSAFRTIPALKSVVLPSTLSDIGNYAFAESGTVSGIDLVVGSDLVLGDNMFSKSGTVRSITFLNAGTVSAKTFSGYTGKAPAYIVPGGTGFYGYTYSLLTVKDGCVPVTTVDGSDGKMLVKVTGDVLSVPEGCVAIAPELLSRNYQSIDVPAGGRFACIGDALVFDGTALVYVRPVSGDVTVPEGIVSVGNRAFGAFGTVSTLVMPSTLGSVAPGAVPVSVTKVVLRSVPSIASNAFGGDPSLFFEAGIYHGEDLSGYSYGGQVVFTSAGRLFVTVNDDMADISFSVSGNRVVVTVTVPETYSESVVTATLDGTPVTGKGRTFTVSDVTGEHTLDIAGVTINKRSITVDGGDSKVTFSTGTVGIPQGTEVRFSVIPDTGYVFGPSYKVLLNGAVLSPVTVSDHRCVYSFVIYTDSAVKIEGIVPVSVHKVVFEGSCTVDVVDGNLVELPVPPVMSGNLFAGWVCDGEYFDPSVPVVSDLVVTARFVPENSKKVTIGCSVDHGSLIVCDGTGSPVSEGGKVPYGGFVVFDYIPDLGYEMVGWNVNGILQTVKSTRLVLDAVSDLTVEPVSIYTVASAYVYVTDTHAPSGDEGVLLWSVKSEHSEYMFSPAIMGGYVYVKSGTFLMKIDLYSGETVAAVNTGVSAGYYIYPAVGNGIVMDGSSGTAYDKDLNPLFRTTVLDLKALYHDGRFYMSDASSIYCFEAKDLDPSNPYNKQNPLWTAGSDRYISMYQGQSFIEFVEGYLICIEVGHKDIEERWLSTYDTKTGAKIDTVELKEMYKTLLNAGYLSYYDGYVYLSAYLSGLFNVASGDMMNLVRIAVDSTGHFDDVDMTYVSFGHNSYSSSLVGYGDYGYINSNDAVYVLDLRTLDIVASCPSTMTHGNISVSVWDDRSVYVYLEPYASSSDLRVFRHDLENPDVLTDVTVKGIIPYPQYGSQQPHFGPEGQVIYHNDSGYLFCIGRMADVGVSAFPEGKVSVYKDGVPVEGNVSVVQGTMVHIDGNVLTLGEYTFVAESDSLDFGGWSVKDGWRLDSDTVLVACFEEKETDCSVSFVFDGFSVTYTAKKGSVVEVPPMVPYRAPSETCDYRFVGWSGYTEGMTVGEDLVFVAEFEELPVCHVTIVYTDSTEVSVRTAVGDTVSGPRDVFRYYLDPEYTVEWSDMRAVTKDIVLYGLDRLAGSYEDIVWSVDFSTGEFTVSGKGPMEDYASVSSVPWYPYREGIVKVVIGDGVTSVGANSFKNCTLLSEIVLSDTVTALGKYSFYHAYALEHIVFGEAVETVGGNVFTGVSLMYTDGTAAKKQYYAGTEFEGKLKVLYCDGFEKRLSGDVVWSMDFSTGVLDISGNGEIPDYSSPTSVPWYNLRGSIVSVMIGDGITYIGANVFYAYTALKHVVVSDTVTYIGTHAFAKIPDLASVDMGSSVDGFGTVVFSNRFVNYNGSTLSVSPSNLAGKRFVSDGKDMVIASAKGTIGEVEWEVDFIGSTLTVHGEGSTGDCSSVTSVPWYGYRSSIEHVVVEDGVTYLTSFALYSYDSVKTVVLGDSVAGIGKNSVRGCKDLVSLEFGEGFTSIGSNALLGTTLLDHNGKTVKTAAAMAGHIFKGSDGILTMQ